MSLLYCCYFQEAPAPSFLTVTILAAQKHSDDNVSPAAPYPIVANHLVLEKSPRMAPAIGVPINNVVPLANMSMPMRVPTRLMSVVNLTTTVGVMLTTPPENRP